MSDLRSVDAIRSLCIDFLVRFDVLILCLLMLHYAKAVAKRKNNQGRIQTTATLVSAVIGIFISIKILDLFKFLMTYASFFLVTDIYSVATFSNLRFACMRKDFDRIY